MALDIPLWVYLAVAGSGAAMQMSAQNSAAKQQRSRILDAQRRQDDLLSKRRENVMKRLEGYDPSRRSEAQEESAERIEGFLQSALQDAQASGVADIPRAGGKVSQSYNASVAERFADEMDRASRLASLMARFRAPSDIRFQEGMRDADLSARNAELASLGVSRANTDQSLINMVQPDPRMMALGGLMQTVGTAGAGGAVSSGRTSGMGVAGPSKPWWDITSGPARRY